jgi:hypothetical protein
MEGGPTKMDSTWVPAALIAAYLAIHIWVHVVPEFRYTVDARTLTVERRLAGGISFGRWRFELSDFASARVTTLWIPPWSKLLGRAYVLHGVVLTFRSPRLLAKRSVFLTPPDPDAFVRTVRPLLVASAHQEKLAGPPEGATPPRSGRLPLWLCDGYAAVSGAVAIACLAGAGYLASGGYLLHALSGVTGGTALAAGAIAALAWMCVWMIADCVGELRRSPSRAAVGWLVAMFVFYPTAWAYYVLRWRPRR